VRSLLLPVELTFNSRHFVFNYSHAVWDEKTAKLANLSELRRQRQEFEAQLAEQESHIIEDTAVINVYKQKRQDITEEVRKLQNMHEELDKQVAAVEQLVKTHFELNRLQKVARELDAAKPFQLTGDYGRP